MASRLEWDKAGRILIPDKTLRRTGLEKDVTLIGVRDHLELWNRGEWQTRREALLARSSEIALRAKQARQNP
jgi:MraZ protein